LPTPSESDIHKGHFRELLHNGTSVENDEIIPEGNTKIYKKCRFGCSYLLTSYAEALRHY